MDVENVPPASVGTSKLHTRIVPWVEKYRPSKVEDVAHQDEVLKTLKTSIERGNLPHLMFHGPPGTFSHIKITIIIAFKAYQLYRNYFCK